MAFTICTNQFHLPENDREGLNGFEEMENEFLFGIFRPEKRTTFSEVPLLPEIFRSNDPKSHVPFTFQPDFPESFCTR